MHSCVRHEGVSGRELFVALFTSVRKFVIKLYVLVPKAVGGEPFAAVGTLVNLENKEYND